ncbi:MAG: cupin domain-containing protein [Candidatus Woesearchaeota archaeon]
MSRKTDYRNVPEEQGHCGMIRKLVDDRKDISMVYLRVQDAELHYHKITTEYYWIMKGTGKIQLDDETRDISAGDLVEITPGTRHRAFDENSLEILVIMSPALRPDDIYRHYKYRG